MLGIFLTVLKIIGLVLLGILALLLLLLLIILFSPVRYGAHATKEEDILVTATVKWLLGIFKADLLYDGKSLYSSARIFGRNLKKKTGTSENDEKADDVPSAPDVDKTSDSADAAEGRTVNVTVKEDIPSDKADSVTGAEVSREETGEENEYNKEENKENNKEENKEENEENKEDNNKEENGKAKKGPLWTIRLLYKYS